MSFLKNRSKLTVFFIVCVLTLLGISLVPQTVKPVMAQFPTVSIPTVTSSPRGSYVIAHQTADTEYVPINVRVGPNRLTERIGVLLVNQEAKAVGKYGDWIQIEYIGGVDGLGWVFAPNVTLIGAVPDVVPPPTSTPAITKTIDPTLAAQFLPQVQETRLPTFTEPPMLMIPTYQEVTGATAPGGIPLGFVIVILAGIGLFLTLIAVLRRG